MTPDKIIELQTRIWALQSRESRFKSAMNGRDETIKKLREENAKLKKQLKSIGKILST